MRRLRGLAACCLFGLVSYAFASSTSPAPSVGEDYARFSGHEVSRIAYRTRGDLITGVTFELDAPARRVDIRLGATGSGSYDCGSSTAMLPFSVRCNVRVRVEDATGLIVSARH